MNITILGGGNWGSALASHLSRNGNDIKIWEVIENNVKFFEKTNESKLLPGIKLGSEVKMTSNIEEAINDTEAIFLVVPSPYIESTIIDVAKYSQLQPIIIATKGFGPGPKLISEIVSKHLSSNIYTLTGPNLANEVAEGKLSGAILGGRKSKERDELKKIIESPTYKIDTSEDIVGLQVGAALKNIVTIFVGIVEGLEMGENTKSYIFIRGLQDIVNIGVAMGGQKESMLGLNGLGDLLLKSRNREIGIQIGKGKNLKEIISTNEYQPEGLIALENAIKLSAKLKINTPVIHGLFEVLYNKHDPKEVIMNL